MDQVTTEDIGIQRQLALYQQLTDITGQDIPIVEGADIVRNPKVMLKALCARQGVPFTKICCIGQPVEEALTGCGRLIGIMRSRHQQGLSAIKSLRCP